MAPIFAWAASSSVADAGLSLRYEATNQGASLGGQAMATSLEAPFMPVPVLLPTRQAAGSPALSRAAPVWYPTSHRIRASRLPGARTVPVSSCLYSPTMRIYPGFFFVGMGAIEYRTRASSFVVGAGQRRRRAASGRSGLAATGGAPGGLRDRAHAPLGASAGAGDRPRNARSGALAWGARRTAADHAIGPLMSRFLWNTCAPTAAAFALCTSVVWAQGGEHAPLRGTELHWVRGNGADPCISAAELRTRVAARLGQDPFSPTPGQWLEGFVERQGQRWSARVYERDASGTLIGSRLLHSDAESCGELDQALVLTVALLISPGSAGDAEPPPLPPPSVAAPEKQPETVNPPPEPDGLAVPPRQEVPRIPQPRRWVRSRPVARIPVPACNEPSVRAETPPPGLLVSGLLGKELLPGSSPGLELSTDAPLVTPLRWRLAASYFKEQRLEGDRAFGFGLTALSALACVESRALSGVVAGACPGAMVGSLHSVVYRLEPLEPGERLWSAARLDLFLGARTESRFRTELGVELVLPLTRWTFETSDGRTPSEVFSQPWLIPVARFAVGYSFE